MLRFCILLLAVGSRLTAVNSYDDNWRSNCTALSSNRIAPFLYHTQADLAVLAFYSNVDYDRFKNGKRVEIYITPICFVKGYTHYDYLTIVSGTQRCPVRPLNPMIEYPSLFFLRRQPYSDKWLLLNGGEYSHIVNNRGILYGLGTGGKDYPQMCGVNRRRVPIDVDGCKSTNCKAYCTYKVARPDACTESSEILSQFMPRSRIPRRVRAYDTSVRNTSPPVRDSQTANGRSVVGKYSGGKTNSSSPSLAVRKASGDNGGSASIFRPLVSLVIFLSGACFSILR